MRDNTISTLFVGQKLIKLFEVDSTNTYAKQLVSKNEPLVEGTAILAESQYAGRGQQGNVWQTEAGQNLICSFVFTPSFLSVEHQFMLNKVVCVSIATALNPFLDGVLVKWPNDIYVGTRKIGGILIELILNGTSIKHAVLGIGLNINQTQFPDSVPNASSLALLTGNTFDKEEIFAKICASLEAYYLQLKSGNVEQLNALYLDLLLGLNRERFFEIEGQIIPATIRGVNTEGKLILEMKDLTIRTFDLKELKFLF